MKINTMKAFLQVLKIFLITFQENAPETVDESVVVKKYPISGGKAIT